MRVNASLEPSSNSSSAGPDHPVVHTGSLPASVQGLTKRFGAILAVSDLSFDLQPGVVTGFLGPNGAGKSTTLRVMAGLLRPNGGKVTLFGEDARLPRARRRLGYMPADPVFVPHLSGHENLALLADMRSAQSLDAKAAAQALDLPELALNRAVDGYSSGMRQKLAIVAALQTRPDLVILDEPANRLDPLAHEAFCDLVRGVAGRGGAVLLSSHVLSEVEELCDSVIMLREGRLLGTSSVEDLRARASRAVVVTYRDRPVSPPAVLTAPTFEGRRVRGRIPADRPDLLREVLTDPDVTDLTVTPATLEDVFLDLYSRAPR